MKLIWALSGSNFMSEQTYCCGVSASKTFANKVQIVHTRAESGSGMPLSEYRAGTAIKAW